MANSQSTYMKRQRELIKSQKRKDKARRKAAKAQQRSTAGGDVDPDIAGIVPGPQPHPWQDEDEHEDEGADTKETEQ